MPPRSRRGGISARSHILQPGVDLTLGLVLGNAVSLLDPTNQLDATALDEIKVIIRELAPLLLNLATELLPIAFDSVPIRESLLLSFASH